MSSSSPRNRHEVYLRQGPPPNSWTPVLTHTYSLVNVIPTLWLQPRQRIISVRRWTKVSVPCASVLSVCWWGLELRCCCLPYDIFCEAKADYVYTDDDGNGVITEWLLAWFSPICCVVLGYHDSKDWAMDQEVCPVFIVCRRTHLLFEGGCSFYHISSSRTSYLFSYFVFVFIFDRLEVLTTQWWDNLGRWRQGW